jgi:hypothetical protein
MTSLCFRLEYVTTVLTAGGALTSLKVSSQFWMFYDVEEVWDCKNIVFSPETHGGSEMTSLCFRFEYLNAVLILQLVPLLFYKV